MTAVLMSTLCLYPVVSSVQQWGICVATTIVCECQEVVKKVKSITSYISVQKINVFIAQIKNN